MSVSATSGRYLARTCAVAATLALLVTVSCREQPSATATATEPDRTNSSPSERGPDLPAQAPKQAPNQAPNQAMDFIQITLQRAPSGQAGSASAAASPVQMWIAMSPFPADAAWVAPAAQAVSNALATCAPSDQAAGSASLPRVDLALTLRGGRLHSPASADNDNSASPALQTCLLAALEGAALSVPGPEPRAVRIRLQEDTR